MEASSSMDAAEASTATPPQRRVVLAAEEARPLLVGVWDLVTAEYRENERGDEKPVPTSLGPLYRKGTTEVGNVIEYLGQNPRGMLMYTSNGFMSVQLMSSNRPDFRMADRLSGTSEEVRVAFESFHSYYGRFHVENGSVLHHIEGCSFPNLVGTSQRRYYELKLAGMSDTDTPAAPLPDQDTAATPSPGPSTDPSSSTTQDLPGPKEPDAGPAAAAAGPSPSVWEPDELILRTAPIMMRGKSSVGVLVWRRASGPLGPDESFPGRSAVPPPDFYEQASMSTVYRLLYIITAVMVLLTAILPAISFSSSSPSQSCKAR